MNTKRLRKDQHAVSPVIATILMVAITVVLAGTLLLLVSNMTDTDSDTQTGAVSAEIVDDDTLKVSVVVIPSADVSEIDITINGEMVSNDDIEWSPEGVVTNAVATITQDGNFDSGDFTISIVMGNVVLDTTAVWGD